MTTFTKVRKVLAAALATIVLGTGVFAVAGPASADCYDTYVPSYHYTYVPTYHYTYHYSYGYRNYGHNYGYNSGY